MQGKVLGPTLCSVSTAEYCTENPEAGVQIGNLNVGPLVFVDDTIAINDTLDQVVKSHSSAKGFGYRKRLKFSTDPKCKVLIINKQITDSVPNLELEGELLTIVDDAKYLGNIFNSKEIYRTYLHWLLNWLMKSNTWKHYFYFNTPRSFQHKYSTKLSKIDISELQCSYICRIAIAPGSTASSFIFLEFGVLQSNRR